MPASAGRVKMPHNNRMSTSGALQTNDIWQKTIGHDPYSGGNADESGSVSQHEEQVAATATVLAAAREQNSTNREGFALKLYQGLKRKKKHRADDPSETVQVPNADELLLQEEESSSEDEYVIASKPATPRNKTVASSDSSSSDHHRRRKDKKSKHKKRRRERYDDESSKSHRKRKKHKSSKKKQSKRKKRSDDSS